MLNYAIRSGVDVPLTHHHLRLWQTALALLESDFKAGRVVEADLVTNRQIRVVPIEECIEALTGLVTPEQTTELQTKYSTSREPGVQTAAQSASR